MSESKKKKKSSTKSTESGEHHTDTNATLGQKEADSHTTQNNEGHHTVSEVSLDKRGSDVQTTQSKEGTNTVVERTGSKKSAIPATPRGHHDSKQTRGGMKFGERPSISNDQIDQNGGESGPHFDPSRFERMTAVKFHRYNDLASARGVGYTPNQAVSPYGPGVTDEAERLYGPCRLLTDFRYSTWTETIVPLRNHNVVQGFNEMILFLIKLAASPDEPVNHEQAFLATSFLANIRNDLGEHPPNVLALLEHIDNKTRNDGTERPRRPIEVIPPCKASSRY